MSNQEVEKLATEINMTKDRLEQTAAFTTELFYLITRHGADLAMVNDAFRTIESSMMNVKIKMNEPKPPLRFS